MCLPAEISICCMRNDPLQILVRVNGVDLTSASLKFAVSINQDAIGRRFVLLMAPNKGDEGVRLVRSGIDANSLPFSIFEIIGSKDRLLGLPVGSEFGDDADLYFELQTDGLNIPDDITNIEKTLARGPFIVKGSIND